MNARLNRAQVTVLQADVREVPVEPGTVVTVGDVFYDERLAAVMLPALRRLAAGGAEVLVGDPQRAYLPRDTLEVVATYDVDVVADLEDTPVMETVVARLLA
jgi:predicted nicotinamide N-methyase